jgi:hypothetical protein
MLIPFLMLKEFREFYVKDMIMKGEHKPSEDNVTVNKNHLLRENNSFFVLPCYAFLQFNFYKWL